MLQVNSALTRRSILAAVLLAGVPGVASAADFVFGDFENGLDPNLELQGPGVFNGSVTTNVTHGAKAGSFSSASGWNMYLRYSNGDKSAAGVLGQLQWYNDVAVDINVPAGTTGTADSWFVHELVIQGTAISWTQSGNLKPTNGGGEDLKGQGTVTLEWPYRQGIADFNTKYEQAMADPGPWFQVILISNYGTTWDGGSFTLDNLRLSHYLGDANLDATINGDDYALIDKGMAAGLTGWANGDFNVDGKIDAADYLLIDKGLAHQQGMLSPQLLADRATRFGSAYVAELAAAVPEPGLLGAMGAAGVMCLIRRRRA